MTGTETAVQGYRDAVFDPTAEAMFKARTSERVGTIVDVVGAKPTAQIARLAVEDLEDIAQAVTAAWAQTMAHWQ